MLRYHDVTSTRASGIVLSLALILNWKVHFFLFVLLSLYMLAGEAIVLCQGYWYEVPRIHRHVVRTEPIESQGKVAGAV